MQSNEPKLPNFRRGIQRLMTYLFVLVACYLSSTSDWLDEALAKSMTPSEVAIDFFSNNSLYLTISGGEVVIKELNVHLPPPHGCQPPKESILLAEVEGRNFPPNAYLNICPTPDDLASQLAVLMYSTSPPVDDIDDYRKSGLIMLAVVLGFLIFAAVAGFFTGRLFWFLASGFV